MPTWEIWSKAASVQNLHWGMALPNPYRTGHVVLVIMYLCIHISVVLWCTHLQRWWISLLQHFGKYKDCTCIANTRRGAAAPPWYQYVEWGVGKKSWCMQTYSCIRSPPDWATRMCRVPSGWNAYVYTARCSIGSPFRWPSEFEVGGHAVNVQVWGGGWTGKHGHPPPSTCAENLHIISGVRQQHPTCAYLMVRFPLYMTKELPLVLGEIQWHHDYPEWIQQMSGFISQRAISQLQL